MNTTMFMSNVKKVRRVALAFDVLHRAVKAIPEDNRSEELSKVLEEGLKERNLLRVTVD